MPEFKNHLFACYKDIKVAGITCIVPCFTFGKVWSKLGDSCIKCGLVACVPCANVWFLAKAREQIRNQRSIEGTLVMDLVLTCFCGACVLCQAAMEVDALDNMEIERT